MINTALFTPLNMLYIGVVLIVGLYGYDWLRCHVQNCEKAA